ncbi:hypothetical protein BOTBODRAFT_32018 [Botryobasidium botryosum FD-172 SS1]|uniref:Polysaccharide lyase family 14 protein n=1 Tax=Botryobasidium botryosum (strain FD-172 SS1) TaxID=930990 RepID=A0A067MT22_BOTB1|nr:hypothetical protein BOTBODRAFT_32018 [Botryobasidium botryosum FD-172 SS1]
MRRTPLHLLLALALANVNAFVHAIVFSSIPLLSRRTSPSIRASSHGPSVPATGFYSPADGGGQMLTFVPGTFPAGLGEPLNCIISGHSDPEVLVDSPDKGGLRNFFNSIYFSGECLGQHLGSDQGANLGDGHGILNETAVLRYNYGDPYVGTCQETVEGGNHFRYWIQNGPDRNSGAIFMGVSIEKPISAGHDIVLNGYNLGRDWLVGNATGTSIDTINLMAYHKNAARQATSATTSTPQTGSSSGSASPTTAPSSTPSSTTTTPATSTTVSLPLPTLKGTSSFGGYNYTTTATYISGLLANTSEGINHYITVSEDGRGAIDGLVAVLEIHITGKPSAAFAQSHVSPLLVVLCFGLIPAILL